jgi:hypothetical protein
MKRKDRTNKLEVVNVELLHGGGSGCPLYNVTLSTGESVKVIYFPEEKSTDEPACFLGPGPAYEDEDDEGDVVVELDPEILDAVERKAQLFVELNVSKRTARKARAVTA